MDQKLLEKIADLYNLHGVEFQHKVEEGFLTHNYILSQNKVRYFLKQYSRKTNEARVKEIHDVILFFNEKKIPVILPLKNKTPENFFGFKGIQYALFPFVNELKIKRNDLSNTALKNMGEMLAKIHLQSKAQFPRVKERQDKFSNIKFFIKLAAVLPFIEGDKDKSIFGKLAYQDAMLKKRIIENNMETIKNIKPFRDHLIHGDYHNGNIFFDQKDNIVNVFDFDKTEIASRVFELIRSMYYMCFEGVFENENFEKAKIYLSAYNNLYPISRSEIRKGVIGYFFNKAQSLWIETYHYIDKNTRVDHFLDYEVKTLVYLEHNLEDFIEKLTN